MLPDRALNFILLTHPRELAKSSNTGQLVLDLPDIASTRIVWSRTEADPDLLKQIERGGVCLAWPGGEASGTDAECHTCIVIDATWQEARKIYNRSPYLQSLPTVSPQAVRSSSYTLRRNQVEGGLSTAECVAAILDEAGSAAEAKALLQALEKMQAIWRRGRGSIT